MEIEGALEAWGTKARPLVEQRSARQTSTRVDGAQFDDDEGGYQICVTFDPAARGLSRAQREDERASQEHGTA
jgi:hypothetical protein